MERVFCFVKKVAVTYGFKAIRGIVAVSAYVKERLWEGWGQNLAF